MVRAARALLSAVTHLLVLADMSDVYKLLMQLKLVNHPYFWYYRPPLCCTTRSASLHGRGLSSSKWHNIR